MSSNHTHHHSKHIGEFMVLGIESFLILLINIAFLTALYRRRRFLNWKSTVFIANVSVSDLLCAFSLLATVVNLFDVNWSNEKEHTVEYAIQIVTTYSTSITVLNYTALFYIQYFSIKRPLIYRTRCTRMMFVQVIVGQWLFVTGYVTVKAFMIKHHKAQLRFSIAEQVLMAFTCLLNLLTYSYVLYVSASQAVQQASRKNQNSKKDIQKNSNKSNTSGKSNWNSNCGKGGKSEASKVENGRNSTQTENGENSNEIEVGGESNQSQNGGNSSVIQNGGNPSEVQNGGNSSVIQNGGNSSVIQNGGNSSVIQNGGNPSEVQNGGNSNEIENGGKSTEVKNGGNSKYQHGGNSNGMETGGESDQSQNGGNSNVAQRNGFSTNINQNGGIVNSEQEESYTYDWTLKWLWSMLTVDYRNTVTAGLHCLVYLATFLPAWTVRTVVVIEGCPDRTHNGDRTSIYSCGCTLCRITLYVWYLRAIIDPMLQFIRDKQLLQELKLWISRIQRLFRCDSKEANDVVREGERREQSGENSGIATSRV